MKKEIVTLKDISVEFEGNTVLDGHNLTVFHDDFIGIIGPNGGGKTTLLKVILGLVKPSRGEISVFGTSPERARKQIGYVPQMMEVERDFPISVWDTVLMGRLGRKGLFRSHNKTDYEQVEKALKIVEMFEMKNRKTGALSGGERQRVMIARALASEPKLLLLDEPTASIDPKLKTDIYDLLNNLKNQMAVILVTHDIGVISSHVDKVACLNCQLFYHDSKEIPKETIEAVYQCPVDIIAHGTPHRVLKEH
ncbi:MAG: ABC transporter ATP-binding protein [Deltaproteobacteria bacterium]|nr:ABC transporter ATP-binding protein [Deltaproteobacteria bacterium]